MSSNTAAGTHTDAPRREPIFALFHSCRKVARFGVLPICRKCDNAKTLERFLSLLNVKPLQPRSDLARAVNGRLRIVRMGEELELFELIVLNRRQRRIGVSFCQRVAF